MIDFAPTPAPKRDDWWPCACVKRTRKGRMSHIKLHHPSAKKCRACGCTKKDIDAVAAKTAAKKGCAA